MEGGWLVDCSVWVFLSARFYMFVRVASNWHGGCRHRGVCVCAVVFCMGLFFYLSGRVLFLRGGCWSMYGLVWSGWFCTGGCLGWLSIHT